MEGVQTNGLGHGNTPAKFDNSEWAIPIAHLARTDSISGVEDMPVTDGEGQHYTIRKVSLLRFHRTGNTDYPYEW